MLNKPFDIPTFVRRIEALSASLKVTGREKDLVRNRNRCNETYGVVLNPLKFLDMVGPWLEECLYSKQNMSAKIPAKFTVRSTLCRVSYRTIINDRSKQQPLFHSDLLFY